MSDQTEPSKAHTGLETAIDEALEVAWARHSRAEEARVDTTIADDVITCRICGSTGMLGEPVTGRRPITHACKRDLTAVITRLSSRRIASFDISRDPATDETTVVFALRPSFGEPVPLPSGRRARLRKGGR